MGSDALVDIKDALERERKALAATARARRVLNAERFEWSLVWVLLVLLAGVWLAAWLYPPRGTFVEVIPAPLLGALALFPAALWFRGRAAVAASGLLLPLPLRARCDRCGRAFDPASVSECPACTAPLSRDTVVELAAVGKARARDAEAALAEVQRRLEDQSVALEGGSFRVGVEPDVGEIEVFHQLRALATTLGARVDVNNPRAWHDWLDQQWSHEPKRPPILSYNRWALSFTFCGRPAMLVMGYQSGFPGLGMPGRWRQPAMLCLVAPGPAARRFVAEDEAAAAGFGVDAEIDGGGVCCFASNACAWVSAAFLANLCAWAIAAAQRADAQYGAEHVPA